MPGSWYKAWSPNPGARAGGKHLGADCRARSPLLAHSRCHGGEERVEGGLPPSFPDLDCTKAAAVVADFPKLQSDLKLYPRVVGQPAQSTLEYAQYP